MEYRHYSLASEYVMASESRRPGSSPQSFGLLESTPMNVPSAFGRRITAFLVSSVLGLEVSFAAEPATPNPSDGTQVFAASQPGPYSLRGPVGLLGGPALQPAAYEILDFKDKAAANGSTATIVSRGGVKYVQIAANSQWTHSLRTEQNGINYVTFTIGGSVGTTINIAGAAIRISQSARDPAYATVEAGVGAEWQPLNHDVPILPYSRQNIATLNVVTIKLDHRAARWTIWFRDLMLAYERPLMEPTPRGTRWITVTAGQEGAWLCSAAFSDVNPLFEDANVNDVPDDFEKEHLGQLLRQGASAETKAALIDAWREERRTRPPSEFIVLAPKPDQLPEWCRPSGVPIHGMANTLIIRSSSDQ